MSPVDRAALSVTPRLAGTLILLREHAGRMQVCLLERSPHLPFAAGVWAFPGGALEERDHRTARAWAAAGTAVARTEESAATDAQGGASSRGPALVAALRVAAIRETAEETGLLIGPPGAVIERAQRQRLESGIEDLEEVYARRSMTPPRVELWSRWVTPEGRPRRYDAYFFVANLEGEVGEASISPEATRVEWVDVTRAIADADAGSRSLMTPTSATLREIAQYRDGAAVADAAQHSRAAYRLS
jgi:8-oxo-dGTP pyrophosphatase MutT (NUDIX family)